MKRNEICHCGSGVKYKKCCLFKEQGFEKIGTGWKRKDKQVEALAKRLYESGKTTKI